MSLPDPMKLEFNNDLERMIYIFNISTQFQNKDDACVIAQAVNGIRATALPDEMPQALQKRWNNHALLTTHFPEMRWAVPGILPEGLTILAGRPKLGKSWLALQIANAVGSGGKVFDKEVQKARVLYMALEDVERRLQSRLKAQHAREDAEVDYLFSGLPLAGNGLIDLENDILAHQYRVVIIDTLSRALGGRSDQQDLEQMTAVMGKLQKMALTHHVAILAVDHHRKTNGLMVDPIDDIMGSTGKSATVDAVMGLYRERGNSEATLHIVGRDTGEDQSLCLHWDHDLACWQVKEQAVKGVKDSSSRARVIQAIRSLETAGDHSHTKRISEVTGIGMSNVSETLAILLAEGLVYKGKKQGQIQPYHLIPLKSAAIEPKPEAAIEPKPELAVEPKPEAAIEPKPELP